MINTNEMHHACTRKTMEEISTIINKINKVIQTRGYITKAALYTNVLDGGLILDEFKHVGWTIGACEHAVLTVDKNYYNLYLPQPDWFDNENENENENEKDNDEMDRHYIGIFDSRIDARFTLDQAIGTAELYGHVTMAYILDLIGDKCEHTDTKRGWTESCINKGRVENICPGAYAIILPRCNWFDDATMIKPSDERSTVKSEQSQPEPINITIPANKPELIGETIHALFSNLEKIKDRPVFISIV